MQATLFVILAIVFSLPANALELPEHSSLLTISEQNYHIRTMGNKSQSKPTVILLSGPNMNWHSDSAWFSLLQPLLATEFHTIVIDRAGNAWSDHNQAASYSEFSTALPRIINTLAVNDIILVSFASSNITSLQLAPQYKKLNIKAMLWLDPDIMLEDAIKLYTAYPADWYNKNIEKILPHIAQGKWTEKTQKKNTQEIEHIQQLIPKSLSHHMDWEYLNSVLTLRKSIKHQQTRAVEIANYANDLKSISLPVATPSIPTSIIDTAFELHNVKTSDENYAQLIHWQKIGSDWSETLSKKSGGEYIPISTTNHLVTFEQPTKIVGAIKHLAKVINE